MANLTTWDIDEIQDALSIVEDMMTEKEDTTVLNVLTPVMTAVLEENEEQLKFLLETAIFLEAADDTGNTAVNMAIKKKNLTCLRLLLEKGANPNTRNNETIYALHYGVDSGDEKIVDMLCEYGADVNVRDYEGQTALHYAVYYGNKTILETLLKYNADVDVYDHKNRTPLFIALWKKRTDILSHLLLCTFAVDLTTKIVIYQLTDDQEVSPAMYAAYMGYTEALRLLIQHGANPHKRDNPLKRSALYFATLSNEKSCVDVILEESDMEGVIIETIKSGDIDYLKLLLECKLDEDLTSHAIFAAVNNDSAEALSTLLEYQGAQINRPNKENQTAVHRAVIFQKMKCLKILLKAGADVNIGSNGGTPLISAVGLEDYFTLLLQHGCDVDYRTENGKCAVTVAATRYSNTCMNLLIQYKANINAIDDRGWSALMIAASDDRYLPLESLLEAGADINYSDVFGTTAVHAAVEKKSHSCLELLITHKANINAVMRKTVRCIAWTPIMLAIKHKSKKCLRLLLKNGALASIPVRAKSLKTVMTNAFEPGLIKMLHAAGAPRSRLPDTVFKSDTERTLPRWRINTQMPCNPVDDVHEHYSDNSLFNICRLNIRHYLTESQPYNLFHTVSRLPLPKIVKSYLLFDIDLNSI